MKKRTSSRTTISIPYELKKRMEKAKEPINWSGLACAAFEAKLNEIQLSQEVKSMSDVIARLRASKQEVDSAEFNEGFEAGQEWAKETATFAELRNLCRLREQLGNDRSRSWKEFFDSTTGSSAYGIDERLYCELHPEDEDRGGSSEFWEGMVGDEPSCQSDEWVRGFAEGALAIFDQIANQI